MPAPAFLRDWRSNRGLVVSIAAHATLLAATLVAFSRTPPDADATESIAVEMISTEALSQVMKGEKSAKVMKPTPKVDKIADLQETKPLPPVAEAKKDVPLPPPPLKRIADPGEDDKPEPQPQKTAALPPPRPVPDEVKPPPKPEPTPTPPQRPQEVKAVEEKPAPDDAEPVRPKPVERPKDIAKEVPKPEPKPTPPKPVLKVDEVAKLLANAKPEPAAKPATRPKSGEESQEPKTALDLTAISKILDHDRPQRRQATGAQLQQVAAVGAPTASASKMAPSMWDSFSSLIQEQYQRCWSQSGRSLELNYYPVVRVQLSVDGRLSASPVLTNPAGDADRRALGEAAIRAVRMCDPLRIPAQFASYYSEWKSMRVNMRTEN